MTTVSGGLSSETDERTDDCISTDCTQTVLRRRQVEEVEYATGYKLQRSVGTGSLILCDDSQSVESSHEKRRGDYLQFLGLPPCEIWKCCG